jgi:long-chain acyl-CoA synthetase
VKQALITRWPYGLTEGRCTVILDATAHPDKLATVGRPSPGTDIRIIDQRGDERRSGRTVSTAVPFTSASCDRTRRAARQ